MTQSAEERVRAAWENAVFLPTGGPCGFISADALSLSDWCQSEDKAWSAALAFTEQRREEIQDLREEIDELNCMIRIGAIYKVACIERILARLEAALADKLQGWKEQE